VAADVARCAWLPREGLEGAALAARRQELCTLIDGCVVTARAHYYQGLCDVAAVLLLTCGGARSAACLTALLRGHLRGPAGASLEPVTQQLSLLPPLLRAADAELASFLARAAAAGGGGGGGDDDDGADFDCRFALPWLLTMHAHSAPDSDAAQRLFDFLLASPPVAPLYLGAAAALLCRQSLLGRLCDAAEAHHLLSALPPLSRAPAHDFLAGLATTIERPRAIIVASAHWETERPQVNAVAVNDTIHDFYGFPRALYDMTYPAPGDAALAGRVLGLLNAAGLPGTLDHARGLDHGAWVPLLLAYPAHDIPVLQLSVQSHLGPAHHEKLGAALAPLRAEGVLILGSGSFTHDLRRFRGQAEDAPVQPDVAAFADWMDRAIAEGRRDDLLAYRSRAPHAVANHPTDEHLLPLYVAMGAAGPGAKTTHLHQSAMFSMLRMDAYAFQ
jgi:4,5-DOPA dioxygenase extradiol